MKMNNVGRPLVIPQTLLNTEEFNIAVDSQDSRMVSIILLKEKKLLHVKLGELPSWILMRDFTPSGIAGAFQRGQRLLGVGEYKRVSGLHVSFCPE